ncbi:restriction endonuclease subunit S [Faecalibacterium prausnitzii]
MEYALSELFTLQMGKTPSRDNSSYWKKSENNWISIADLTNSGKYISNTKETLSDSAVAESGIKKIPANTVIMSFKLSLGKVAITEKEMYSNEAIMAFIDKGVEKISPEYLYYLLRAKDWSKGTNKAVMGATLNKATLSTIKIQLHEYDNQLEIVNMLNRVSSSIDFRKQQLTKLDELIKARFVEMFGDPISNPFGFKVKTLQKMIDDGTIMYHLDGNHGSDYPRNEEFVECGVPYISANCIVHNDVNLKLAKHLTEERASKLRKGIAQNGDVLFAHNATVGPVAILYTDDEKVILGTSLTAYRCDKERMVPDYLKAYMQSEGFVCQYTKDMKQTTRNQVPITAQRKFLFVIPPLSLQNQFAAFAAEVDKSKLFAELFAQNACILAENRSK